MRPANRWSDRGVAATTTMRGGNALSKKQQEVSHEITPAATHAQGHNGASSHRVARRHDQRGSDMSLNLLPLGSLGAVEQNGTVTFGIWLPWVSANDGNSVTVKIFHDRDQFLPHIPASYFLLNTCVRPPSGHYWAVTVPIAGTPPGAAGGVP